MSLLLLECLNIESSLFHLLAYIRCRTSDTVMSIKWIRCRCWDRANPSRGFRECCSFSSLDGPGRFSLKREGKAPATLSLPSKYISIRLVYYSAVAVYCSRRSLRSRTPNYGNLVSFFLIPFSACLLWEERRRRLRFALIYRQASGPVAFPYSAEFRRKFLAFILKCSLRLRCRSLRVGVNFSIGRY